MHNRWQVTPLAEGKVESFPAAGLLEIAGIAGNLAGERRVLRITDVVWAHPASFRRGSAGAVDRACARQRAPRVRDLVVGRRKRNGRLIRRAARLHERRGAGCRRRRAPVHPGAQGGLELQRVP